MNSNGSIGECSGKNKIKIYIHNWNCIRFWAFHSEWEIHWYARNYKATSCNISILKSILERFHFPFFYFGQFWTVRFINLILLIIFLSNHTFIERWEMSDEPSLGEHLRSCRIFAQSKVSYQNDRPRALPAMAQGTQLKNYTYFYWLTFNHHKLINDCML